MRLFNPLAHYFDAQEQRLILRSVVIGVVVWSVVFTLKTTVHWLFDQTMNFVNRSPSPLFILLPISVGSLLMAFLIKFHPSIIHYRDNQGHIHPLVDVKGDGLERAIALYFTSEPALEQTLLGREGVEARWELPTFSLAFRKFLATLVTLGSGGSGGLEASVTLIGECIPAGLFKPHALIAQQKLQPLNRFWQWWRCTDPDDLQAAQLGGIAAAISTLLGAPFTAAFFATEVMYRRRPIIEKLLYSLVPALIAFFLNYLFTGHHTTAFVVAERIIPPAGDLRYFGLLIVMAFLISQVAIYFGSLRRIITEIFTKRFPNVWLRHLVGAWLTAAIALIVSYAFNQKLDLVLGLGDSGIEAALDGKLIWYIAAITFFAKMLATLFTIGSGGSAGLLIPALFLGTMIATALSPIFNYPPMILIVPAMTASLVSIVNVPLAAILLVVELFGSAYMVPALVTLVVTAIFSHQQSIYRPQREKFERREILPGFGVRRVLIPAGWHNQTLIQLDIRRRFGLTIIGIVEQRTHNEQYQQYTRFDPPPDLPLQIGDVLVVLGEDDKLNAFEIMIQSEAIQQPVATK